ncbi:MAG TPA: MFS transporter [Actinomycetota bacterium]
MELSGPDGVTLAEGKPRPRRRLPEGTGAVLALFLVQFSAAVLPFGIGALAPYLTEGFGLSAGQVGLATSILFACVAICSVPAGRFVDRSGVPRGLWICCAVIACGSVGLALSQNTMGLAIALGIVGVGYALVSPATNRGVLETAPRTTRGRLMGIKQMGVTAGGVAAAALLPAMVLRWGFGTSMFFVAVTIATVGIASSLVYRSIARSSGHQTSSAPVGAIDPRTRRRVVTLGAAIGTMVAAQHCVATYLTLYLVASRGLSITAAAGMLALLHGSGTVARFGWGWVSDRMASRLRTMQVIGALAAATSLGLGLTGSWLPSVALIALIVVLGAATQGGNAVFQTAIAEEAPSRAGWASGVGMSLGFTGAIVAPPIFGALIDATGSYVVAFALSASIPLVGVAITHSLARDPSAGR